MPTFSKGLDPSDGKGPTHRGGPYEAGWTAIRFTRVSRMWVVACNPEGLFLTLKDNSDPKFGISIPYLPYGTILKTETLISDPSWIT